MVATSSDSEFVAVGTLGGRVRVWELATLVFRAADGPSGWVPAIDCAFYPVSGKKLGRFTPRNGCMTPRTWQKCISQLRPPQS